MVIAVREAEQLLQVLPAVTDSAEIESARLRRDKFDANWTWFQSQIVEMGKHLFGKHVCIAGGEAFVADSSPAAVAAALAAHPDDDGRFVYYFPTTRAARVYAHHG